MANIDKNKILFFTVVMVFCSTLEANGNLKERPKGKVKSQASENIKDRMEKKYEGMIRKNWSSSEQFVWIQVCMGKVADFNIKPGYGGLLDPKKDRFPNSRILSSRFLKEIIFNTYYRDQSLNSGIFIVGARFTESIFPPNLRLNFPLLLVQCLFEKNIDLIRLESTSYISFQNSKFAKNLNLISVHIEKDLSMRFAEFQKVSLSASQIGSQMDMTGSTFFGELDMNHMHIGGDLLMDKSEFFDQVNLQGSKIDKGFSLARSQFKGNLNMVALELKGVLSGSDSQFKNVLMSGGTIEGVVMFNGAKFNGNLKMNYVRVRNHIFMQVSNDTEFREVDFSFSKIEGNLLLQGGNINGELNMDSLNVGGDLWIIDLTVKKGNMQFISVGQSILLKNITFDHNAILSLSFSNIGSWMQLIGGPLSSISLQGTSIKGPLILAAGDISAKWHAGAVLDLRNTKVGFLVDSPKAWPDQLILNGFVYGQFGGMSRNPSSDMANREVDWYKGWLPKEEFFTFQPYQQLASILENEGQLYKAQEVLFVGQERNRNISKGKLWWWLTFQYIFVGYGFRIHFTVYWVLGFMLLGAFILKIGRQREALGMDYGISYSLDMLLPIVELRKFHSEIDLQGWVRYYFYFHKVMGFVLASYLVAGLSGLTKY